MNTDFSRIRFYHQATEPTGGTATTPPATEPPAETASQDNANNAQRRLLEKAQKEATEAKAEADRLKAQLKQREEAELSETERLKRENDELKPLRDEHGRFQSALQGVFDEELAGVPEDKREQVLALAGEGSLDSRLKALLAAKALITPGEPAPRAVVTAGTRTQPAAGQAPTTQERIDAAIKSGNSLTAIELMREAQGLTKSS